MTKSSEENQHILVQREELEKALKILTEKLDGKAKWASLSFKSGQLSITAGSSNCVVGAMGRWPEPIFIEASWVRSMAKLLPKGDPIFLRTNGGLFYTNNFSQTFRLSLPRKSLAGQQISKVYREQCLEKAATLLKPFRITPDDLEKMVDGVQTRGPSSWLRQEKAMIELTAKAWAVLAPLGVETGDLRVVINEAVRTAFSKR